MATAAFAQAPAPTISPKDQVSVAVFGVERLTGKFPVEVDGSMNYPLLGPVKVAGLTTRELEAELGRRLTEGGYFTITPQITVDLEQTPNKRVTVTGAVRSTARTLPEVIAEIAGTTVTERGQTRADDRASEAAMEDRKREGYF